MSISLHFTFESGRYTPAGGDIVRRIYVEALANQMKTEPFYAQSMAYYLPSSLMAHLGKPSQIWFQLIPEEAIDYHRLYGLDGGPNFNFPQYYLVLAYESFGLAAKYRWNLEPSGRQWMLCPGRGLAVSLYIQAPQDGFSAAEMLPDLTYYPLEQAAGMDVDTFYETFKDVGSQVCLKTPARIWKKQ